MDHEKEKEAFLKTQEPYGHLSKPSFQERHSILYGTNEPTRIDFFRIGALAGISTFFAIFQITLNLRYTLNIESELTFAPINVFFSLCAFCIWQVGFLRLLQIFCSARENGLSVGDRTSAFSGAILGSFISGVSIYFTFVLVPSYDLGLSILDTVLLPAAAGGFFVVITFLISIVLRIHSTYTQKDALFGSVVSACIVGTFTNWMFFWNSGSLDQYAILYMVPTTMFVCLAFFICRLMSDLLFIPKT